jgi:hypothetical protein
VREPGRAGGCIRSVRAILTAALGCAALTGCGAGEPREVAPAGAPRAVAAPAGAPDVAVTHDDRSLPPACRPRALALRLSDFLDAVSRGDPRAARFVAASGGLYSVGEGSARHFVTYDRAELRAYFARRHQHGERMRLLELAVGFANGLGQIEFRVDRRADDLRRLGVVGTVAHGKGAVNCSTRQIVVWSMGMATRPQPELVICGRSRAARGAAVVACARRWR